MKWLKKMTKWFKSDEVYEIEEIVLEDNEDFDINELKNKGVKITTEKDSKYFKTKKEKSAVTPEKKKNRVEHTAFERSVNETKNQEINAKVSYQYPKGQFRFPVIPDYNEKEVTRKKKPLIRRQKERSVKHSVHQDAHIPKVSSTVQPERIKAVKNSQPENIRKRPFRASEIPSPVYGFQKRPNKENSTEFELIRHSSLNNNNDTDIPAVLRNKNTESTYDHSTMNKQSTVSKEDISVTETSNVHKQQQHTYEQRVLKSSENAHREVQIEEPNSLMKNVQQEDLQNESRSVITVEPIQAVKDEEIYNTHLIVEEEVASTIELEEIPNADITVTDNEEPVEELITDDVKHIEETDDDKELTSIEEEKKRKHIPFNVVMLRQDKERWQQRKDTAEKKTIKMDIDNRKDNVRSGSVGQTMQEVELEHVEDEDLPYYQFPSLSMLTPPITSESDNQWLEKQGTILNETLHNFNVRAKVVNITQGPAVTQFEVQPEPGVKVSKVTNLTDDIKLCLAAQDIRMEAPIPGKHTIGIEIPNRNSRPVFLREILESPAFKNSESPLTVALGLDITGAPIVTDLRKMPHGLIAGATGSGKSVCMNTMLVSLLYKATPQEVKVLLIDPKVVELAPYNAIPHLVSPVITDVKAATAALKWAVDEMERRYELFAHTGVRDINRFNAKAEEAKSYNDKLPFIVIIIDELADLMMMSPADVEEAICRIAQKARACGIHLIVATQRPSVDVITGLIKANIPTRIAFSVSSQVDSRTIIDSSGAEKLLGRGDMLFLENGSSKTVRLQGTFVSDEEIEEVVDFVKKEQQPQYLFQQEDLLAKAQITNDRDELFLEACEFVVYQNAASASSLQRRFHVGYNRAARLMEMMESNGIISESRGSRPRDVLMTVDDMKEWLELQVE